MSTLFQNRWCLLTPTETSTPDAIARLRHVLADQPHAGDAGVVVHVPGELLAPATGIEERRHERHPQRQRLQLVTPDEAAARVVAGLVAQAAPAPGGGWEAIVSLQVSAMEGGAGACHFVGSFSSPVVQTMTAGSPASS